MTSAKSTAVRAVSEIYLDNNATTQPLPEVIEAVARAMGSGYGNPSSVHRAGERARRQVREARASVASLLRADPEHVIFTSGATEANNLVLQTLCDGEFENFKFVMSRVEHSSVLAAADNLRKRGVPVIALEVNDRGIVDLDQLVAAIEPGRTLVSIQWANNETGVIQPIEQIAALTRSRGALFHTDAVQAVGKLPIDLDAIPVDFLTLSGHKIHGPQGVGALVSPILERLKPLIFGGSQERALRPGTENVPGIVGLGVAMRCRAERYDAVASATLVLREHFELGLHARGLMAAVNGQGADRLPNTSNVRFEGVDGEALMLRLDQLGVRCSQSSACTNHKPEPSYVLRAMGLSEPEAFASVRFGFSEMNTAGEVDRALDAISEIHASLTRFALA